MDYTGRGAEVDEPVQILPALSTQASNPTGGGCQREGQHERPGSHACGDEPALGNVMDHGVHVKKLVEPHEGCEMQCPIEESEKAEHAAKADQPGRARQLPQGSYAEGD